MCGIIGYVGNKSAVPIIVDGLRRLEYRGYDSAGIAVVDDGHLAGQKAKGHLEVLEGKIANKFLSATTGIGHTRWATHGTPSDINAHPHYSADSRFAVVHNGIIENHHELRAELTKLGFKFQSDTDTEVIVHLLEASYTGDLAQALLHTIARLKGAFAILAICESHPDEIVAIRNHSPLILGVGENANYFASDAPALLAHTRDVVFLDDFDLVRATQADWKVWDAQAMIKKLGLDNGNGKIARQRVPSGMTGRVMNASMPSASRRRRPVHLDMSIEQAEKGGYEHFMLKEIHEQPTAIENTLTGRIGKHSTFLSELEFIDNEFWRNLNRIIIVACGTALHAGMVAKYALEDLCEVPVDCAVASEFRYGKSPVTKNDLIIAVTQSGETADTLAGCEEAKKKGAKILTICNVLSSSIPRLSHATLYTHAGPEIGVASTKAYTTQIVLLELLAIYLGRIRGTLSKKNAEALLDELWSIPALVRRTMKLEKECKAIAEQYSAVANYMYVGRRYNYPTAFEGALKLKEISYIHAEGYGAGEMKHGPIALVTGEFPTVAICVESDIYDKMLSNIEEIKSRGGNVIGIASSGDRKLQKFVDRILYIPRTSEIFSPILSVIPLQMIAYYAAVSRGCNPDKPRNLA
ncbi:MAG: glutamine--fructose-6-phosphate transaminase (isomerizing), partial [Planctomycetes bacterium]|nr:glutamine--fructose-6-phosphate transaminase (isomerizing) [Planctomycetota bacterium]